MTRGSLHVASATALVTVALVVGGHRPSDADRARDLASRFASIPCPSEDSIGCLWDAETRGNGRGHSFVTVPVGSAVFVVYDDGAVVRVPTDK